MRRTANQVIPMRDVRNGSISSNAVASTLIGQLARDTHLRGQRFTTWPAVTVEHFNEASLESEGGARELVDADLAEWMFVHVAVVTVPR